MIILPKILILEDEPQIIIALKNFIDNHEVHVTNSINKAISLIANNDYRFMIIDQYLIGERGLDLVRTFSKTLRKKTIILTGDPGAIEEARRMGCLAFDKLDNLYGLAEFINNGQMY